MSYSLQEDHQATGVSAGTEAIADLIQNHIHASVVDAALFHISGTTASSIRENVRLSIMGNYDVLVSFAKHSKSAYVSERHAEYVDRLDLVGFYVPKNAVKLMPVNKVTRYPKQSMTPRKNASIAKNAGRCMCLNMVPKNERSARSLVAPSMEAVSANLFAEHANTVSNMRALIH